MDDVISWWNVRQICFGRDYLLGDRFDQKNDEEKVKVIFEYFSIYEKLPRIHRDSKSAETASEYIVKANKNLQTFPWQLLAELYTESIIHAPPDSYELIQAHVNRAVVLYNSRLYDDCRRDVNRLKEITYPSELGNNLSDQTLHSSSQEDKILNLKLNRKPEINVDNLATLLNNLSMSILPSKPNQTVGAEIFLPQTPDDNGKITQASAAIELKYSEKYGRLVIATRNIKAGEVLLVHKSYGSIVDIPLLHKYCWQCSKRTRSGVPCYNCTSIIYCNEACRDEAWRQHHDIECSVIVAMLNAKMGITDLMALRLTVKAYKEAGSFEALRTKLHELDAIQDPIAKCFIGDVFDHTKHASVYSLWKNTSDEVSHALRASLILYFLATTSGIFDDEIANFGNVLDNEWALFIGGLILRHVEISIMNSITICIDDDDGNSIDQRSTLNPFISLFNHSCDPMVIHYVHGEMNAIISLQNIKKGEQIYYDYGFSYWNESTDERRAGLLEKFSFVCECRACLNNWGPHSRLFLPSRVMKSWPAHIEENLSRIRRKYPTIISMLHAHETDKPLIISTTFDMINLYQRTIRYCTRELFEFKTLLHHLFYSVRC